MSPAGIICLIIFGLILFGAMALVIIVRGKVSKTQKYFYNNSTLENLDTLNISQD